MGKPGKRWPFWERVAGMVACSLLGSLAVSLWGNSFGRVVDHVFFGIGVLILVAPEVFDVQLRK